MHFEILVEDASGKVALESLVPAIISPSDTFTIRSYRGVGRIPKNLNKAAKARSVSLLNDLPGLLRGYGKTFGGYGRSYPAAVVVVCDLDDSSLTELREDLLNILDGCDPPPATGFCIAIEEGEAWFFGDRPAVKAAYPKAKEAVLNSYVQDSICGTWEKLADAVHPGGSAALEKLGYNRVGEEKSRWAAAIAPRMTVEVNASPSFCYFRNKLRELASTAEICQDEN